MNRLTLIAPLAASLLGACTSDGDKREDGAGDAGAIIAAVDDSHKDTADAGVMADAGSVVFDAGSGPTPVQVGVVEDMVDSGTMQDVQANNDGGKKVKPIIDGDSGRDASKDNLNFTVFNRVLVKAKAKDLSQSDMQELVETALKAKVIKVRKTAGTFWLIELAPVTPARKQPDQAKLIETLKATGAFAIVEGDQLMKLK